jgi:hypothetical protein
MNDDQPTPEDAQPNRGAAEVRLSRIKWAFLGGICGLAIALLLGWLWRGPGSDLPPLTRAALEAAEARWRDHPARSYTIKVQVTGAQPATYQVEVRDGEALSASLNGRPLTQRRVFDTWSVPGMFGTLASDVERLEEPENEGRILARCEFDGQYGYPARYERIELNSGVQVAWEVVKFELD